MAKIPSSLLGLLLIFSAMPAWAQIDPLLCPESSPPVEADCREILAQVQFNRGSEARAVKLGVDQVLALTEKYILGMRFNPPPYPADLSPCTPAELEKASRLGRLQKFFYLCPGLPKTLFMSEEEFQRHQEKGFWSRMKEKFIDRTPPVQISTPNMKISQLEFGPTEVREISERQKRIDARMLAFNDEAKTMIYYYPYKEFEVTVPITRLIVDTGLSIKTLNGNDPAQDMTSLFQSDHGVRFMLKDNPATPQYVKMRVGLRPGGDAVEIRSELGGLSIPTQNLQLGYVGGSGPIMPGDPLQDPSVPGNFATHSDFVNYTFLAGKFNQGPFAGKGKLSTAGNLIASSLISALSTTMAMKELNEQVKYNVHWYHDAYGRISYNVPVPNVHELVNNSKLTNRQDEVLSKTALLRTQIRNLSQMGQSYLEAHARKNEMPKDIRKILSKTKSAVRSLLRELDDGLAVLQKEDIKKLGLSALEVKSDYAREVLQNILLEMTELRELVKDDLGHYHDLANLIRPIDKIMKELQEKLTQVAALSSANAMTAALNLTLLDVQRAGDPLTLAISLPNSSRQIGLENCRPQETPVWDRQVVDSGRVYDGTVTVAIAQVNQMLADIHANEGFNFCYIHDRLETCDSAPLSIASGLKLTFGRPPQLVWDAQEGAFYVDLSQLHTDEKGGANLVRPAVPVQIKSRVYVRMEGCTEVGGPCLKTEVKGTQADVSKVSSRFVGKLSSKLKDALGINRAFNYLMKRNERLAVSTFSIPDLGPAKVVAVKQDEGLIKAYFRLTE